MSLPQIFSLVLLAVAFVIAIWRHINVGLVIIPAGFIFASAAHIGISTFLKTFPGDLVILVIGVMYLFGHAQRSGAVDRLIQTAETLIGGRHWLLPWIMFLLAAIISGVGALPAASLAIVVPIAVRAAELRNINSMLMGVVTIMGALAGGFSPISVWGQLMVNLTRKAHYALPQASFFGIEFALNTVVAIVAFLAFGGIALVRRGPQGAATPQKSPQPEQVRMTPYQIGSLVGFGVFVVVVLAFSLDVGLTAFTVGLILHLVFRPSDTSVISELPWSVCLVISGVLLYVGLLSQAGTLTAISHLLEEIHLPMLSVLALAYFGAIFASFESSSVAVLGVVMPVVLGLAGATGANVLLVLSSVAFSVVVVSTSPYHLSGGLVLASSKEAEQTALFRRLLAWSIGVAAVVPVVDSILPMMSM